MSAKRYLVTGGTGFIGAAVVKRLLDDGHAVRVLDNGSRGALRRLGDRIEEVDYVEVDIRDPVAVAEACRGIDGVLHLAFVNGTEFFYSKPELVLEVGVKGMMNVIDGCLVHGVGELVLASSSEVYQTPPTVPTAEDAPLSVPDPLNPRYSYGGGKLISELMAISWGRKHFERVVIFRPHNVYGPDMGGEHVIPQMALRMKVLADRQLDGVVQFPIQGTGAETRAFCHISDFVEGLAILLREGEHLGIYHIGTMEETSIRELAHAVGRAFGREIEPVSGPLQQGGTLRRCPDIGKLAKLGYSPAVGLADGLPDVVRWYAENSALFASTEE